MLERYIGLYIKRNNYTYSYVTNSFYWGVNAVRFRVRVVRVRLGFKVRVVRVRLGLVRG